MPKFFKFFLTREVQSSSNPAFFKAVVSSSVRACLKLSSLTSCLIGSFASAALRINSLVLSNNFVPGMSSPSCVGNPANSPNLVGFFVITEISGRIGPEIPQRTLRVHLTALVTEGTVKKNGAKRWTLYELSNGN